MSESRVHGQPTAECQCCVFPGEGWVNGEVDVCELHDQATFKNPYRYEIHDKMRERVGVRTAVVKDIWSFYGEPRE